MKSDLSLTLDLSKKYYSKKKLEHCLMVQEYVIDNPMIPKEIIHNCMELSLAHDLWEDTECPRDCFLDEYFSKCVDLITKEDEQDYYDYIREIKYNCVLYPEVYWVKLADIKDHICRKSTLSDKLKEKYLGALRILL